MNETLDDIVSWIREIAQSYKQSTAYDKVTIEGLKVCFALENIADRIEAATRENRFHYRTYEEAHQMLTSLRNLGYTQASIVKGKITVAD